MGLYIHSRLYRYWNEIESSYRLVRVLVGMEYPQKSSVDVHTMQKQRYTILIAVHTWGDSCQ